MSRNVFPKSLSITAGNPNSKIQNRKLVGLLTFVTAFAMCGARAEAQQAAKVHRIGFLSPASQSSVTDPEAFQQGLRELGYVEGKNIVIEWRFAGGKVERLRDLAAELVRLKVDVIVARATPAVQAAKGATTTIPIVMAAVADAVGSGFVASLARPGGNITGVTNIMPELAGKRLELLKEIVPKLSRVAFLAHGGDPAHRLFVKEAQEAGQSLGVQIQPSVVKDPEEFESAFSAMARERAGALIVQPLFVSTLGYGRRIAELAAKNRLPTVSDGNPFADQGGLMFYGPNFFDLIRRTAIYVDKILKGAKPPDLPVEQPKKFELVINLKAAKQIGLTIPPNVLARADKVIR
jgi:putative tryptophan/tyrosine transport system substrate-binding protein